MEIFTKLFMFLLVTSAFTIELQNVVDLTWPFSNDNVYCSRVTWYAASEGTYLNIPGKAVNKIPLSALIAPGIKIDLTKLTSSNNKAVLLPEHLESWQSKHGTIPNSSVILIDFGWSQYYTDKKKYFGIDRYRQLNFPGISLLAAQWIINNATVVGVGVDTAGINSGNRSVGAHELLSSHGIYGIENVNIPYDFPEKGFVLYVLPMKIIEESCAPLRLIAVPLLPPFGVCYIEEPPWFDYIIVVISSFVLFILYITEDLM